jgi:hypothetical protein
LIAYIAHDAGGANQVFNYALNRIEKDYLFYAFGPAIKIAKSLGIDLCNDEQIPENCYQVVLGANSVHSPTQAEELVMSHTSYGAGLQVIGFFDGWVNLDKRWPGLKINQYLASDEYAFEIGKSFYTASLVKLVKNYYLDRVRLDLFNLRKLQREADLILESNKTLFLTQPRGDWPAPNSCICEDLRKLYSNGFKNLHIRDHPLLDSSICVKRNSDLFSGRIQLLDKEDSLAKHLHQSTNVVGHPTYALYIAQQLKFSTFLVGGYKKNWTGPNLGEVIL